MPRAATVCSEPGCPETAVKQGRCPAHRRTPWAGRTPMDRNRHAAWARAVLARDQHTCRSCGAPATEADHIINRAAAPHLAYDLDNGQALCRACHQAKTLLEAQAARRKTR